MAFPDMVYAKRRLNDGAHPAGLYVAKHGIAVVSQVTGALCAMKAALLIAFTVPTQPRLLYFGLVAIEHSRNAGWHRDFVYVTNSRLLAAMEPFSFKLALYTRELRLCFPYFGQTALFDVDTGVVPVRFRAVITARKTGFFASMELALRWAGVAKVVNEPQRGPPGRLSVRFGAVIAARETGLPTSRSLTLRLAGGTSRWVCACGRISMPFRTIW